MPDPPDTIGRAHAAGYQIQMTCKSCGRVDYADLPAVIAGGYADLPILELGPKLHCVRCECFGMQLALI
jgi:hypothetical protein